MEATEVNTLLEKPHCYWLSALPCEDGNYYPSIVIQNEPGHFKTDWNWGKDRALAQECTDKLNMDRFGLTPEQAAEIVASSMFPRSHGRRIQ